MGFPCSVVRFFFYVFFSLVFFGVLFLETVFCLFHGEGGGGVCDKLEVVVYGFRVFGCSVLGF